MKTFKKMLLAILVMVLFVVGIRAGAHLQMMGVVGPTVKVYKVKIKKVPKVDMAYLRVYAKNAVSLLLKYPEYADFKRVSKSSIMYYTDKVLGDSIWVIRGLVKSPNELGLMVPNRYRVDIRFTVAGKYIIKDVNVY